jgi:protein STE50
MDVPTTEPKGNMLAWDETDVHVWFTKLGFPQYESQIRGSYSYPTSSSSVASLIYSTENNVTGEILSVLDSDSIKEIGISTIGQRLAILKAIYLVKLAHNIPIEPDHYIPPCV